MNLDEFLDVARALPGVEVSTPGPGSAAPEIAWGDSFIALADADPTRQFPFATVVTKDYPDVDTRSRLDRPGVFRVNFAVGRGEYERLLGHLPGAAAEHPHDPAAIGVLIPHPSYANHAWVSIISAGEVPDLAVQLLGVAHARAVRQHVR
jgi:hypothetical protein